MTLKLPPGVKLDGVDGDVLSSSQWPDEEATKSQTVTEQLEGGDLDDEDN